MALVKLGPLAAAISGSIGGTTFARNRGGAYIRNRTPPLNPSSPRQNAVRQIIANFANRWTTVLTQAQRDAWDNYAANVPLTNSLGESRNVTGLNMYCRGNSLLQEAGLNAVDAAPTELTQGPTFTPTITIDTTNQEIDITAIPGADFATEAAVIFTSMGTPQNPGVNFFKSPFRKIDARLLSATPFVSFSIDTIPFPFVEGQAIFVRTIFCTGTGRVGGSVIQRFLAPAA